MKPILLFTLLSISTLCFSQQDKNGNSVKVGDTVLVPDKNGKAVVLIATKENLHKFNRPGGYFQTTNCLKGDTVYVTDPKTGKKEMHVNY